MFEFSWTKPDSKLHWRDVSTDHVNQREMPAELEELRWFQGPTSSHPMLVPMDPVSLGPVAPLPGRSYRPLEDERGLFLQFRDLPLEKPYEPIARFAEKFGWLGVTRALSDREMREESAGEPLWVWLSEIADMRAAIEVWEGLRAGNTALLAPRFRVRILGQEQFLVYQRARPWYLTGADQRPVVNLAKESVCVPERWIGSQRATEAALSRDFSVAGREFLTELVARKLFGSTLISVASEETRAEPMRLQVRPRNLLSCLWLQFALAVDGSRKYSRCNHCGLPFEVSVAGSRPTRRYCSDACKSAAYRERKGGASRVAGSDPV